MSADLLQKNWDDAYPETGREGLWPSTPVPMVALAESFFVKAHLIIDVPCGDGKNILELAKIGPVIACDTSNKALRLCEARRVAGQVPNVVVMKSDIFSMPFVDSGVSSLFCCDLLGHLPNPEDALKEVRRVLSPSGTAIVTLFSIGDSVQEDPRMRAVDQSSYWYQDKWFFRFYDRKAALELVIGAGFAVVHIEEFIWMEGPHPGYREYEHKHASWSIVLR